MMRTLVAALLASSLLAQPACAAIAFDNVNGNLSDNGGGGTYTHAYTGASLSNGLLVMCVAGGTSTDTNPAATYNGVAMTRIGNGVVQTGTTNRWLYEFYLLAPASGSHTISITQTGTGELLPVVAEYSGVLQSGQPDSSATPHTATNPLTTSITIANANSWAVECGNQSNGAMSDPTIAGSGTTYRGSDVLFGIVGVVDSNAGLSVGSYSMTISPGNPGCCNVGGLIISFQPDTGGATSVPSRLNLMGVGN